MSEYLSKEEVKQWRSSLEKITLEEFAARLGKKIEDKKPTNDLVDIVLHGQPVISEEDSWNTPAEKLSAIANRAYEKEKNIYVSPFSAKNLKVDTKTTKTNKIKPVKKAEKPAKVAEKKETPALTKAKKAIAGLLSITVSFSFIVAFMLSPVKVEALQRAF